MHGSSDETRPLLHPEDGPSQSELHSAETLRSVENDTIPETATYGRNLGWVSVYILVLSRVLGSGIFATPGTIVKSAGSIGVTLLLWIVGAGIAACSLAVTMEYGCMLPRSGGKKVYLEFTYRYPRFLASTLFAITTIFLGITVTNCVIFGKYMLFALGLEPTVEIQRLFSVGLLTTVIIIHGCFLRSGIWIQNCLGWIKIFLVLFMIITGIYVVGFQERATISDFNTPALFTDIWEGSNWEFGTLCTALFKVSYAFAGLDNANNVLNEVKNPIRTLKIVGPIAFITVCALYALVILSYFLVVPIDEIKQSGELVAALFFERVFGQGLGKTILPIAVAISAVGNVMVVVFAMARVNQEVARQGFLPYSAILSSSRPFNTPMGGLIINYIPSFLVIWFIPPGDVYNFILDLESYSAQFFTLAVTIGLLLLRSQRPDLRRPFKAWLPAVGVIVAMCLALIAAPFFPPADGEGDVQFFYATYAIVGIGIILLSVLYWWIWTIVIPRWKGYQLEEEVEVLPDGTSVTKLIHVNKVFG